MVVGFITLAGLIVYLILSVSMIFFSVWYAKKRGMQGWKGGLIATVIMYLILFWDWIPMRVTYSYLCNSQAGTTIFKTFEQWKNENPGAMETLLPEKDNTSVVVGNRRYVRLNQRFIREIYTTRYTFEIRKYDNRIVDILNKNILAQYIDFDTDRNSDIPKSLSDYKPWRYSKSCESDGQKVNKGLFSNFSYLVKYAREYR
ncbi:MAG: hypothetical protein KZQ96_17980 [Candidatus Thiodiazotropha sp. (ex Lucinoma borealis)]|nr:hypothetical protein [Candidatus Thiodiazotropha sp. (ex Lucinoma borealis)]MCU7869289.1 hypothetical protein [Candidatus Thiodiazotropha sp. (ex Lucinoma borealis)]